MAMSSCSLTLFLHPPPPPPLLSLPFAPKKPHQCYSLSPLSRTFKSFKSLHIICFSSNSSSSQNDREESRWLREEQRWLREEQRWLREEQRWARDRDSLLREIAELKLKIQALEHLQEGGGASVSESETIANIAGLLQILTEKNRIAETGSSSRAIELDHIQEEIQEVSAVPEVKEKKKSRNALRKGSEGEEVRAMQEALQKLGFYSGEEDMEFSSFSSGTERAVKTWQASLDAPQDGIVTAELLEQLYTVAQIEGLDNKGSTLTATQKEDTNGAAVTSVTEISEVQQTLVKEGVTEVEEPKKGGESKAMNTTTRCLTCRGEGRLLCTECDGTGEPNIEEQFLDWVEEGAKCPYCEGHGFTICDSRGLAQ
ncbi:plastid transcriptionally active 5 [Prunus dulcis]|uniref:Plastid transcriptionally active 5 n=1 Tax=Prunus dulcis TaxID=3755 RepID=A0A4Y1QKF4_PRUDU|nr:plastid transcriptionally active 5 [Prunus dulcis]